MKAGAPAPHVEGGREPRLPASYRTAIPSAGEAFEPSASSVISGLSYTRRRWRSHAEIGGAVIVTDGCSATQRVPSPDR